MKIYHLQYEPGYAEIYSLPPDPAQRKFLRAVQRNPGNLRITANWRVIDFYIVNSSLPTADFLWWGSYPCCTRRTFLRIADAISRDVAAMPVRIANTSTEYVLLFARHTRRGEDIELSPEGRASMQQSPQLPIAHPCLFVDNTYEIGQLFCVSDYGDRRSDFYLRYRENGFTGVKFGPVSTQPSAVTGDLAASEACAGSCG